MRIIVADDHPLFRDALARLVASLVPDASVVEAADVAGVQAALNTGPTADLLLLDLNMPGSDGVGTLAALVRANPGVAMLVVSGSESPLEARQALAAGALGFVRKSTPPAALSQLLAGLIDGSGIDDPRLVAAAAPPAATPAGPALTPRQFEVLALLCTGESNKRIASRLGLAEGTVKLHVAAILQALQAETRTAAASRARALGWV